VPKFTDLRTLYPHVLYHGLEKPSEVVLKKYPPDHWTPISQISKRAQGAILVSEDWAFYSHPGYDEHQIREAIQESVETRKLKRGASTITQQVVRNIYLSKEKSLIRKLRELWMATKIEKVLNKTRILELYLNIAELGQGVYGIGEASNFYFQKPPSQLNAKEGAFLAMLLPSPKRYAISFKKGALTPYARKTIHAILNKMVMAQMMTENERDLEWATPLSFEKNPNAPATESDESESDEQGSEEDLQSE